MPLPRQGGGKPRTGGSLLQCIYYTIYGSHCQAGIRCHSNSKYGTVMCSRRDAFPESVRFLMAAGTQVANLIGNRCCCPITIVKFGIAVGAMGWKLIDGSVQTSPRGGQRRLFITCATGELCFGGWPDSTSVGRVRHALEGISGSPPSDSPLRPDHAMLTVRLVLEK